MVNRTVENIITTTRLFLGFVKKHVPKAERPRLLSMELLLNAQPQAAFWSFQVKAGCGKNTVAQRISHLRSVLAYLEVGADPQQGMKVEQMADWLGRLGKQLVPSLPMQQKSIAQLQEQGEWLPAADVVQLHDRLRVAALSKIPASPAMCSPWAAMQLQGACMVNLSMEYMPPVRPSCIISLQVSDPQGRCLSQDCRQRGCFGTSETTLRVMWTCAACARA